MLEAYKCTVLKRIARMLEVFESQLTKRKLIAM